MYVTRSQATQVELRIILEVGCKLLLQRLIVMVKLFLREGHVWSDMNLETIISYLCYYLEGSHICCPMGTSRDIDQQKLLPLLRPFRGRAVDLRPIPATRQ